MKHKFVMPMVRQKKKKKKRRRRDGQVHDDDSLWIYRLKEMNEDATGEAVNRNKGGEEGRGRGTVLSKWNKGVSCPRGINKEEEKKTGPGGEEPREPRDVGLVLME